MITPILTALAALLGLLLGVFLKARLEEPARNELNSRMALLHAELEQAQRSAKLAREEITRMAGFETLAAEKERQNAALGRELAETRAALLSLQTAQSKAAQQAAEQISRLETELRNERENLAEKLSLLDQARNSMAHHFEALAGEILEKKTKSFSEGSQKELGTLLTPLKEQLENFRKKVEEAQSDSKTGVTKLETLVGQLNNMNQQLSEEARNLATALRGSSKTQGDWGEFILRDLLEKAGLREGDQYSFQESFNALEGDEGKKNLRTDVIVNLPGGRRLIIDSKLSLNAWQDATEAATDEARQAAMKRHMLSVRNHIDELARRRYHKLPNLESPDFVVMFVPLEPAFLGALREDESLWRYGWEREVLLVGPTTLLFVIRIVDNLWQQEQQAKSVRAVMERGSELYDKFVGFVSDLEAVGKSLRAADAGYSNAMKKLSTGRGNLVRQVEMLRELGVRSQKQIPKALLDEASTEEPLLELAAAEDAPESR